MLVKSYRSPLLLTISGRFWIIPVFCDQLFQKTWKNWRGSEPSSSYERRTIPNDPGTLLISETEKRCDEDAAEVYRDNHDGVSLVLDVGCWLEIEKTTDNISQRILGDSGIQRKRKWAVGLKDHGVFLSVIEV